MAAASRRVHILQGKDYLTRRGTYVFITRRGTFVQICTIGDYSRSDQQILQILTDSYLEFNSLSTEIFIFKKLQSL